MLDAVLVKSSFPGEFFSEPPLGPSGKQSWYTFRRKELCNVGGQGR
jgi:hypothetical protein